MLRKFRLAFLILTVVSFAPVRAAELEAFITPQTAHIGDTLRLQLRVKGAGEKPVVFPQDLAEPFEILRIDTSHLRQNGILFYTIAAYDTGQRVLSDLVVVLGKGAEAETLYAPAVTVDIRSMLADTSQALKPLKPYRKHPFQWRELLAYIWIPVVLLLAGAGWWLGRKFLRRRAGIEELAVEKLLPPHEEAVRALIELRDRKYPSRGMLKEFFTDYSHIMRRYLERRYEFPALEMTTFELKYEMENAKFPPELSYRLLPVLSESDLVKFAKHIPDPNLCDGYIETGFELINLTIPRPEQEVEAEAA